jgi:hypothetical protein
MVVVFVQLHVPQDIKNKNMTTIEKQTINSVMTQIGGLIVTTHS